MDMMDGCMLKELLRGGIGNWFVGHGQVFFAPYSRDCMPIAMAELNWLRTRATKTLSSLLQGLHHALVHWKVLEDLQL